MDDVHRRGLNDLFAVSASAASYSGRGGSCREDPPSSASGSRWLLPELGSVGSGLFAHRRNGELMLVGDGSVVPLVEELVGGMHDGNRALSPV